MELSTILLPKIGYIDRGDIKVGIACAGNVAFSMAAMQYCFDKIRNAPVHEYWGNVQRSLARQYRNLVFSHPNYATDTTLRYWHLVGMCCPGSDAGLYVTEENSIREVKTYACIGIGEGFANYMLGNCFREGLSEMHALYLAAMMLSEVKENVPGCGGASHFLILRRDGSARQFTSTAGLGYEPFTSVEWSEKNHADYQRRANRLFMSVCDCGITDKDLEGDISKFVEYIREIRSQPVIPQGRLAIDLLNSLRVKEEQPNPQDSTVDPSRPQPSQESRGESDES